LHFTGLIKRKIATILVIQVIVLVKEVVLRIVEVVMAAVLAAVVIVVVAGVPLPFIQLSIYHTLNS
jgi:hypothetical protein